MTMYRQCYGTKLDVFPICFFLLPYRLISPYRAVIGMLFVHLTHFMR